MSSHMSGFEHMDSQISVHLLQSGRQAGGPILKATSAPSCVMTHESAFAFYDF
jgi:hypothetical protein